MKKIPYVLPIVAVSALLTACGGGGGGANHSSAPAPTETMKSMDNKQVVPQGLPENNNSVSEAAKNADRPTEQNQLGEKPIVGSQSIENPKVSNNSSSEQPIVEIKPIDNPPMVEKELSKKSELITLDVMDKSVTDKDMWSGSWQHSKDAVPVLYLIENPKASADEDPNIIEKKTATIKLKAGHNVDDDINYRFYLLDDNAYYGFYRDSVDMKRVDSHLVYGYHLASENKGNLSQLTANYKGEFWYQTLGLPNVNTPSKVELTYENGVAKGVINSRDGYKMFDVQSKENPRELELTSTGWLDNFLGDMNKGNKGLLNIHFINATDGTENKVLVGKGGNDLYWGVIGAEKQ
ncbi:hypothetical protein [Frederiksenia canicola]